MMESSSNTALLSFGNMYYALILALAVVGGAYAQIVFPDYLGAYSDSGLSAKLLMSRVNFSIPENAEQRSYAVLKNVVSGLADMEIVLKKSYDEIYIVGTIILEAIAKSSPEFVKEVTLARHDLAMTKTAEIRKLVKEKCLPDATRIAGAECNQEIQKVVDKNPKLRKEALLLLLLGKVGNQYLGQEAGFHMVAQQHTEINYLKNRNNLREIVKRTVEAYKVLYAK